MYIDKLRLTDLRCFRQVEMRLVHPERTDTDPSRLANINLLLGNNGSGKTSILRALALSPLGPVIRESGYVPYRLIRRGARSRARRAAVRADIILHGQDVGAPWEEKSGRVGMILRIERRGDYEFVRSGIARGSSRYLYEDRSPAFFVVGYGATRRVESSERIDATARDKARRLRYERVAGLFEDLVALVPLRAWLPPLRTSNPGRFKQVQGLLDRLLPEQARFTGRLEDGDYVFEHLGVPVPFAALSDGYRAYIGWIGDLLYHITMGAPSGAKLVDSRGVVLVDEIDLHLHPEWQRTVVPTLSRALPKLQFIVTSHSPIVAGTLHASNVFVMEMDGHGASTVHQYQERIHGLNADQVLTSSYFGLTTTRAPDATASLIELSRKAGKGDRTAVRDFARMLAGSPRTRRDGRARRASRR